MDKKENVVTGNKQERKRDKNGRFLKGVSGNPRGRPKTDEEIKEALRDLVPQSIEVLRSIILNEEAQDKDRLRAIEIVFERVYGKPFQQVAVDETSDREIRVTIDGGDQYGD